MFVTIMKLFAKRTKKAAPPLSAQQRTVFKSDPVCEELLQKDPSTWNAKQRRMMRRYQERKKELATEEEEHETKTENIQNAEIDRKESKDGEAKGERESADAQSSGSSESDDSESSSDDDDSTKNGGNDNKEIVDEGLPSMDNDGEQMKGEIKPDQLSRKDIEMKLPESTSKVAEKALDLSEILERLDSKNRRKLRRKLDRGESTEEDIRKEAMAILEPTAVEAPNEGSQNEKRPAEETAEEATKKGKKRSKVDWSTLPPEERMRREDQRRRQQEVAALRESGELPATKHRHPLNSERRRANRRKPKWERTSSRQDSGTNHHHTSGFQMRKNQATA